MTRPAAPTTDAVTGSDHQLGQLLARMVREADARIPQERRARRTLQEMMPGYERQPVLVLARPVMADDACPLCGRWNCDPATCPPSSAAPLSTAVTASGEGQCSRCGGVFPGWNGGVCDACQATGR
ncbi:hypothetical protein HCJ99_28255 [Streptomyces sp. C1-2]|nr:hypothetical protein [Streptomyces sp. C1-2]NJP74668.1 hypothetical protein [Streptomyces sp. C1-2]